MLFGRMGVDEFAVHESQDSPGLLAVKSKKTEMVAGDVRVLTPHVGNIHSFSVRVCVS